MILVQGETNAEEMLPRKLSTVIKKIPVLSYEVKGKRKLGLKKSEEISASKREGVNYTPALGQTSELGSGQSLVTPWTVACQAPLPIEFSRQEFWSRLPFPSPGDLPQEGEGSCIS